LSRFKYWLVNILETSPVIKIIRYAWRGFNSWLVDVLEAARAV
jgi:hypothetical protein